MASNSSWLAAYEAQKAAVLEKMGNSKSESKSSAIVSGASEFSGLVDIDSVKNFSKSTQVTKLMNTLKKPQPNQARSEEQRPVQKPSSSQTATSSSPTSWNSPAIQSSPSSTTWNSQSSSTHRQSTTSKNDVHSGFVSNWNPVSASIIPKTETLNVNQSGPYQDYLGSFKSDKKMPSHSATANAVQNNTGISNRKKKRENGEVPIKDLFKRVKSDSTKNSTDWARVCLLFKAETLLILMIFFFISIISIFLNENVIWIWMFSSDRLNILERYTQLFNFNRTYPIYIFFCVWKCHWSVMRYIYQKIFNLFKSSSFQ